MTMLIRILISVTVTCLVASCSSTRDITNNPSDMTDFGVGKTYKLKQPVFVNAGKLKRLGQMGTPKNLEDIRVNRPSFVEGVLETGIAITIRKVEAFREPMTGNVTDVFGEVLSGEQKGKLVNVTWISKPDLKSGYTKRDPTMLEIAEGQSK